ncbi:hypothetical protein ACE1TI_16405 [Alteribacillus sp. JSM 102045]|uniref:hypothetical protein n=1 Tax=Alteribacillus sp. JSM 102045 TaxID=1562101 RepID=UPI0035BEEF94
MNTSNAGTLYKKTSFATYVLTFFLKIATVPIIIGSVRNKVKEFGNAFMQQFFSHGIFRPYALVLFWSPIEILLADPRYHGAKLFMVIAGIVGE